MSSWANNPFNPYRLPPRVTPDMLISDRNGLTGQPLRPEDDQPDDGTATSSVGIPSAGTSAPYDLSAMNPQPRVRPTPPPQPQPPQAQMPPQVTPQMMGDQSSSGPQNRVTVQSSGFGQPDNSDQGMIRQVARNAMQPPEGPKQPPAWRQILAGLAGTTNLGSNFAPLIAYGPKGLQQMRQRQQYEQDMPRQIQAAGVLQDLSQAEEGGKNREALQADTRSRNASLEQSKGVDAYNAAMKTIETAGGELYDGKTPLKAGEMLHTVLNPSTGKQESYLIRPPEERDRRKKTAELEVTQSGYATITPEMAAKLPEWGYKGGEKVPPAIYDTISRALQARVVPAAKNTPAPTTEEVAIRATGKQSGNPTVDAMTPAEAQEVMKRAKANPEAASNRDEVRSDKSYTFNVGQLEKIGKPFVDTIARMGRLNDTLNQNTPQADALVAPELLTVMAGGQGSGLRMNEAEISRIIGGRSHWQDLQAAVKKWSVDPKAALSITPEQRQQIRGLVKVVNDKLMAKQALLDKANEDLISSDDPTAHRRTVVNLRKQISDIDQGTTPASAAQHKIGDTVMYQGKPHKILAIGKDGKLQLEP